MNQFAKQKKKKKIGNHDALQRVENAMRIDALPWLYSLSPGPLAGGNAFLDTREFIPLFDC